MAEYQIIKSYLVSLGFKPDEKALNASLKQMDDGIVRFTDGMARSFIKVGGEIAAVYAAIGSATLGMMDKVAMADLGYQLYATKMYMSVDAAKRLKIATDALGYSLDEIAWNPELRGRFLELQRDQMGMQRGLGGDFEAQMRNVRDFRFELTRLKVEAEYGAQNLTVALMREFGGPDKLLAKFRDANAWLQENLPQLSHDIAVNLKPVLVDIVELGKALGEIFKNVATEYVHMTGELSGDEGLKNGDASIKNIAHSTELWLHALTEVLQECNKIALFFTSHPELAKIALGAYSGAAIGSAWGPVGIAGGALFGGGAGAAWSLGSEFSTYRAASTAMTNEQKLNVMQMVRNYAKQYGVPENIALAVAQQESGFNQKALSRAGAVGVMQLMPRTAQGLGVDPYNAEQNIAGGVRYLSQLHSQFDDWPKAIAAYNEGPGAIAKGRMPAETASYVPAVMNRAAQIQVDSITVNVSQPNATQEQIHAAVKSGVRDGMASQNQRTLLATGGPY